MKKYCLTLVLLCLQLVIYAQVLPESLAAKWYANDHFQLIERENTMEIRYQKLSWEAFTLYVGNLDLSIDPVLRLEVQSDQPVSLRVDILDKTNKNMTTEPISFQVGGNTGYQSLTYDFRKMGNQVDLQEVAHFQFFVAAGSPARGILKIRNFQIPEKAGITSFKVNTYPNPAEEYLIIETNNRNFDEIIFTNTSGDKLAAFRCDPTTHYNAKLDHLPSGVCYYQLRQNDQTIHSGAFVIR